jgi:hypothetical protein
MDNQRFDLVGKVINNNLKLREKKEDDRITRDLVEFMQSGGESIIL